MAVIIEIIFAGIIFDERVQLRVKILREDYLVGSLSHKHGALVGFTEEEAWYPLY